MAAQVINDIVDQFDRSISTFVSAASVGLSDYVIPLAFLVFGIGILVWCFLIMMGRVQSPAYDWMAKLSAFVLVVYIAGPRYLDWVVAPLSAFPIEVISALLGAGSSPNTILDTLYGNFSDMVSGMLAAVISYGKLDLHVLVAGCVLAMLAGLIFLFGIGLLGAALLVFLLGKIGLAVILALGPLFIASILLPAAANYFRSWLNTCVYFALVQVLSVAIIKLFLSIVQSYMRALSQSWTDSPEFTADSIAAALDVSRQGSQNLVVHIMPLLIICGVCIKILMDVPSVASSLSAGSGSSGVSRIIDRIINATGGKSHAAKSSQSSNEASQKGSEP